MALIDLVLLRLAFSVLSVCVCQSQCIGQRKEDMHALFQTMAGRKMLLLSALSSAVLSSARWLLALAMSRYRSELAIRSVCTVSGLAGRLCLSVQLTRLVSELGDRAPRRLFSLSRQRHRIPRCSASNQLRLLFKEPK